MKKRRPEKLTEVRRAVFHTFHYAPFRHGEIYIIAHATVQTGTWLLWTEMNKLFLKNKSLKTHSNFKIFTIENLMEASFKNIISKCKHIL